MKLYELINAMSSEGAGPEAVIMVRDTETGMLMTPKSVVVEHHDPEESVGGTTIWLDCEVY